jgi:hypothetical protein
MPGKVFGALLGFNATYPKILRLDDEPMALRVVSL